MQIKPTYIEINTVAERKTFKSDPLASQLAGDMSDTKNLPYYKNVVRKIPASILLRARGEVLEEKNIKKSDEAMFAYMVEKHTGLLKTTKTPMTHSIAYLMPVSAMTLLRYYLDEYFIPIFHVTLPSLFAFPHETKHPLSWNIVPVAYL